jgi:hypothetical protein
MTGQVTKKSGKGTSHGVISEVSVLLTVKPEEKAKPAGAKLKATIQKYQTPATTYFNSLSDLTIPQVKKAQRFQQAFQQVLDDPDAEKALQHPALKPLLEQAAD